MDPKLAYTKWNWKELSPYAEEGSIQRLKEIRMLECICHVRPTHQRHSAQLLPQLWDIDLQEESSILKELCGCSSLCQKLQEGFLPSNWDP